MFSRRHLIADYDNDINGFYLLYYTRRSNIYRLDHILHNKNRTPLLHNKSMCRNRKLILQSYSTIMSEQRRYLILYAYSLMSGEHARA